MSVPKPTAGPSTPKTETLVVKAPEPATAPKPEPAAVKENPALQRITEALATLLFVVLTLIPLARLGVIPIDTPGQITILIVVSGLTAASVLLYQQAGFRPKAALEVRAAVRRRDDAVVNAVSLGSLVVLLLTLLVEAVAILVFLKIVKGDLDAIVTAASHFVLFATFVFLVVDLLLITRTTFDSRHRMKSWHRDIGYFFLGLSGLILLLALLKNLGVLSTGLFAQIRAEQSAYIVALAAAAQLIAFRLLLRYPSLAQIFHNELDVAKHANRDQRNTLERRALHAYFIGIGFVLLSFFLIGGVATGRVAIQDRRTSSLILVGYVVAAFVVLLVILFRYLQHRWIAERARRAEAGELIARRRLTGEQMANIVIYSVSIMFALVFVALGVLAFMKRTPFKASLGTDFLIMAFLIGVGPYGFRHAMKMRRVRAMDDKFPDFLRDLAEGLRAGMTLPRALRTASKGVYGALTPEIHHMSSQVEWGVSFTEALTRFAQRVQTPLIGRTVSLINEASRAGGSVVDILTAASSDAREIKMIVEERHRQMGIYSVIIYVAFLVFLVVIFVLAAQFLPSFQDAVSTSKGGQVGGLSFTGFSVATYVQLFFHAALIQGIGGGLVAGVMTDGHPVAGLKHSFIMTIVSWVFFRGFLG